MVKIWAQELLWHHFIVINRIEKMMGDVDALTWRFGDTFAVYLCVANILRNKDELKHSYSYDDAAFTTKGPKQLKTCNENIFVPVLTVQWIWNISQPANIAPTAPPSELLYSHFVTAPFMLHNTTPQPLREFNYETTYFKQLESIKMYELIGSACMISLAWVYYGASLIVPLLSVGK